MSEIEQVMWSFVSASIGVWLAWAIGYIRHIRRRRRQQRVWRDNFAERQRMYRIAHEELTRVAKTGDILQLLVTETHVLALQTQLLVQLHFLDAEGITEMPLYVSNLSTSGGASKRA